MAVLIANASSTSDPILRSDDGSYAWQFSSYQNNASRLLTVLNSAYNATVVWIANRNHPVSADASLLVQMPSCAVLLRDVDGFVAWSPPVSGIRSILLNTTGNLMMFNAQNSTLWQSFDDASDVLLAGQTLKTNHSLISRVSLDNVSEGFYTLRMEPGGVVLYASFDWQQQMVPYAADSDSKGLAVSDGLTRAVIQSARLSKCNHTNLIYSTEGTAVALQQDRLIITPECRAESGSTADDAHSLEFGTHVSGMGMRLLRLMPNSDINTFLATNSDVVTDIQLFAGMLMNPCMLPSYCGTNSLCSLPSNCTCPDMFEPIGRSAASGLGCRLSQPFNCSIFNQHQFLAVPGLDYFANTYLEAPTVSSPDRCQSLCRANCSCTAAFYRNNSGTCHLYDQVQTMLPGSNPSITAFLRVARLSISNNQAGGSLSTRVIIGAATGVAMMMMVVALLVGWMGRKFMTRLDNESDSEEEAFLESLPGLPPRLTYKELYSATEGFSRKLGTGGSGAVYEGHILPPAQHRKRKHPATSMVMEEEPGLFTVAVKELQMSRFPTLAASGKKQFRAEVATLGILSHVNLVQLRGFCAEGSHRLLVYEFLENGSLDRWIFSSVSPLQWEVRYRIAIDTARGLAYLHEGCRDKVVHLDVKPQNILLDSCFRAKLADFGLCKLVGREADRVVAEGAGVAESQTVTAMRGTPGYMAPEWFLNLPVTDRSDVFSYGMVLLELVGGCKNLNLAASNMEEWYIPAWAVRQAESGNLWDIIDKQLTEHATDPSASAMCTAMSRLLNVAFWCIQENSASRPSMDTVVLMLEEHLQVPNPPLDQTYIIGRQSQASHVVTSTSKRASSHGSAMISELEPR